VTGAFLLAATIGFAFTGYLFAEERLPRP